MPTQSIKSEKNQNNLAVSLLILKVVTTAIKLRSKVFSQRKLIQEAHSKKLGLNKQKKLSYYLLKGDSPY